MKKTDSARLVTLRSGEVISLADWLFAVAMDGRGARYRADGAFDFTGDVEAFNDADFTALTMSPEERRARMQHMRAVVKEHNVYRWAGSLIGELAGIRLEIKETGSTNGWHTHPVYVETSA